MPPRIAKLAGLGAYGACLGMLALFALLIFLTRPVPQGGITPVLVVRHVDLAGHRVRLPDRCARRNRQAVMHIGTGGGPTKV